VSVRRWRFTPVAIAEIAGAVLALVAAIVLGVMGVNGLRRGRAIVQVRTDYGKGRLEDARQGAIDALGSFKGDPALLELAGAAVLGLGESGAASKLYKDLAQSDATGEEGKDARAAGLIGVAVAALVDAAKKETAPEARPKLLAGAEEALTRAAGLAPKRREAPAFLGTVLLARGDAKKALEHFEAAEKAGGDAPASGGLLTLYHNKGVALLAAGRPGEAVPYLKRAVQLAPARKELPGRLAYAIAASIASVGAADGKAVLASIDEGEKSLHRVHPMGKHKTQPLWGLADHGAPIREAIGVAHLKLGLAARGEVEAKLREADDARSRVAREGLKAEGALKAAEEAARRAQDDEATHLKEARKELEEASDIERTTSIAAHLGLTYLALAEREKAKGEARRLLKAAAERFEEAGDLLVQQAGADRTRLFLLYDDAGVLWQRATFPTRALDCFEKAEKAIPAGSEPAWQAARALLARNRAITYDVEKRPLEAVEHYQKAMDLVPGTPEAFAMEGRIKALKR
jgi:tetratricopeptide (TPR) repeat protein